MGNGAQGYVGFDVGYGAQTLPGFTGDTAARTMGSAHPFDFSVGGDLPSAVALRTPQVTRGRVVVSKFLSLAPRLNFVLVVNERPARDLAFTDEDDAVSRTTLLVPAVGADDEEVVAVCA